MRNAIVIVSCLCLGLGCTEALEKIESLEGSKPTPLDEVLTGLKSDDVDRREAAYGRLDRLTLSLRDRLRILTAAAHPYPARADANASIGSHLIDVAGQQPSDGMLPIVRRLFRAYDAPSRVAVLGMVGTMTSRSAAETWRDIVFEHLTDDTIDELAFGTLQNEPRHGDVFVPAVFEHLDHPKFQWGFLLLSLRICRDGLVDREDLRDVAPRILELYAQHEAALRPLQRRADAAFRFGDESYGRNRAYASLLLDLMSCLPTELARRPLANAFSLSDPRLKYFAVASHVRLTGSAPKRRLREVAANPEVRAWLFDALEARRRTYLMPERYRTQEALAESAMVRWLLHENELGLPPSAIVLEDVVSIDTESEAGIVDYFVFRFRADNPPWAAELGWMAGVAGAYIRSNSPTTDHDGSVFSKFEAIDARTPADHVGDLEALRSEWQGYSDN